MSVSPSRRVAFTVLRRVFEQGAFADRALHSEASELSPRDRALATTLVYGTVQRKRTLDHLLGKFVSRPLEGLDPPVLAGLRLGIYQLVLLDGISDYAAVNESVELVKRESKGGAQFVNAVLRRATREAAGVYAKLDDRSPSSAAVLHSVPDWLAEMWWQELGGEQARALLAQINRPAENALRANTLKQSPQALRESLPWSSEPTPAPSWTAHPELASLPEALVLKGAFDSFGSEQWQRGELMPQSRGSMVVARMLDPQPGERVLDLCAAPGGKTTHLAALMQGQGELTAVEVHPGRARALEGTCELMGAAFVRVENADARSFHDADGYDRVLVDPPCSGLGTLQSRPDLRWQPRRGELAELAAKQTELLAAGARNLKPGGTLVYSLCTISRTEAQDVIAAFTQAHPEFSCDLQVQLLPSADHTDGFFIARLRKRS
jgi:16S rRNA (cytosine967-C5)-methyltransferase